MRSLWLFAVVLMVGCGGRATVPVRGTVTCGDRPLHYGQAMFQPTDPSVGRPALATIERNGSYAATTFAPGDGLVPSEYRIAIDAAPPPFDMPQPGQENPPVASRFAEGTTSGLTITIRPGDGAQRLDLVLSAD